MSVDGYEWSEIRTWDGQHVTWVRGPCSHDDVVPVDSAGQTVAHLCLTCDAQLPAGWP